MCSNVYDDVTDFEVLLIHQKNKNLNSPGRNGDQVSPLIGNVGKLCRLRRINDKLSQLPF